MNSTCPQRVSEIKDPKSKPWLRHLCILGICVCAVAYLRLTDGGMDVTIKASNLQDGAAGKLVGDGYCLPKFLPASSRNLVVRLNLDTIGASGKFSFDPREWTEFQRHLRLLTLSDLENRSHGWYDSAQHSGNVAYASENRTAEAIRSGGGCYMIDTNELASGGFYQLRLAIQVKPEDGKCVFWTLPQHWVR